MSFSTLQNVLWAASFVANVILLAVIVLKERWRAFPFFSTWIAFQFLLTMSFFVIYRAGSARLYSVVYWSTGIIDVLLQISIVIEIARIVLRTRGAWIHDTRRRFIAVAATGTLIAASATMLLHPSTHRAIELWEIRANLFASLLLCELMAAMMAAANRLGLQWDDHVMGLGEGLVVWTMGNVLVDGLHDLLGKYHWFNVLDEMRSLLWIGAVIYWSVILWRAQKEKPPLSAEMEQYMINLHSEVQYDLSRTKEGTSRLRK